MRSASRISSFFRVNPSTVSTLTSSSSTSISRVSHLFTPSTHTRSALPSIHTSSCTLDAPPIPAHNNTNSSGVESSSAMSAHSTSTTSTSTTSSINSSSSPHSTHAAHSNFLKDPFAALHTAPVHLSGLPTSIAHTCPQCGTQSHIPLAKPSAGGLTHPLFKEQLLKHFPGAMKASDFLNRTKNILVPLNFLPRVNTLTCIGLCRDEITGNLRMEIEKVWDDSFVVSALGGMLFCGKTGFNAAHLHAPKDSKFIYFCFPHIAISEKGEVGKVLRYKTGMSEVTEACGALAGFMRELKSGKVNLELDWDDVEMSMLKRHLYEHGELANHTPENLVELTKLAYTTVYQDLLRNVLADAKLHPTREYALMTGIHVHGPDSEDYIWPGRSCLISKGVVQERELNLGQPVKPINRKPQQTQNTINK